MALTPEGTPYVESSDLVANYPAASLALANRVDLVGVLPFANSTARGTAIPTPTDGQYSYLQDTNSTEFWNGAAWITASKILQVVRGTDVTQRSTTSTSYVDASLSVTITPQKSTSSIMLMCSVNAQTTSNINNSDIRVNFSLTDSSNVTVSGGQGSFFGTNSYTISATSNIATQINIIGYATPATLSAVTYKLRFKVLNSNTTIALLNDLTTAQLFAIEVST